MRDWVWVDREVAMTAHAMQLEEHGGGQGVRDGGLLSSAMARPRNLTAYGEPDVSDLAAAYAFGIARNHHFVDGNRRTALVVCETFLLLNDYTLECADAELVAVFEELAAGTFDEQSFAQWLRERVAGGD